MTRGPILALFFLTAAARAQTLRETYTYTGSPVVSTQSSDGLSYSTIGTFNSAGGYTLGGIRLSGTISQINGTTDDYGQDNFIQVVSPGGVVRNVRASAQGAYTGVLPFTDVATGSYGGATNAGTWTFRYFNNFDDAPDGQADAQLTSFSAKFYGPSPPPTYTNLGAATGTEAAYLAAPLTATVPVTAAGQVKWFRFTVDSGGTGVTNAAGKFLDVDVSTTLASADTKLGLYNASGTLLLEDDDDGNGLLSSLSFGRTAQGSRTAIGDGLTPDGRDGTLADGTYYLAVAEWNATFDNDFTVSGTGTNTGNITVNVRTNLTPVPEPATALGAAAFAAAAVRLGRRRA